MMNARSTGVAMALGLLSLVSGDTLIAAASTRKPELPPEIGKTADFEPLRARLMEPTQATVSSACGSVMWPWAYRGKLGADRALRPYGQTRVNALWTRDLVSLLFRAADWDSVSAFRGVSKPCDQRQDVPLFAVTFGTKGGDVYALLSFETRCAQIFEAEKPLGTLWFRDRADSLLGLLRSALANDSVVASMSLPDSVPERSIESISAKPSLESLPQPVLQPPPRYPPEAVLAGRSGIVWIQALVGSDGRVHDAVVRRSLPVFDDAALDAVWQWKFRPATSEGWPIAVWVALPIKFTLH